MRRLTPACFLFATLFGCESNPHTKRGETRGHSTDQDGDGVSDTDDCDPTDPTMGAPTEWFPDTDGDGFGDSESGTVACDAPDQHTADGGDCNDTDPLVSPAAVEICNGMDDDCDPATTDAGRVTWLGDDGTVADVTSEVSGTRAAPRTFASTADGTLLFCEGTFHTLLELTHDVHVFGADVATLDGAQAGRVVTVEGQGVDVGLYNLTIRGGSASSGAGVQCWTPESDPSDRPTLVLGGVTVLDNVAEGGGGVLASQCDAVIIDSAISWNVATSDAGGGLKVLHGSRVEIIDSTVDYNYTGGYGGGLAVMNSSAVHLEDTLVTDNAAATYGGAVDLYEGSELTCVGARSTASGFTRNSAGNPDGGAVSLDYVAGANTAHFVDCDFGTTAGGDDNTTYDVVTYRSDRDGSRFAYIADDNQSFSCAVGRCGEATVHTIPDGREPVAIYSRDFHMGEVYEVSGTPSLDEFEMWVSAERSCVFDLFVHSSTDRGRTWSERWSSSVTAPSGPAILYTGDIGVPFEDGDWVALSLRQVGTSCGVVELKGYSAMVGDDLGVGGWRASVFDAEYTSTGAWRLYLYDVEDGDASMEIQVTATTF